MCRSRRPEVSGNRRSTSRLRTPHFHMLVPGRIASSCCTDRTRLRCRLVQPCTRSSRCSCHTHQRCKLARMDSRRRSHTDRRPRWRRSGPARTVPGSHTVCKRRFRTPVLRRNHCWWNTGRTLSSRKLHPDCKRRPRTLRTFRSRRPRRRRTRRSRCTADRCRRCKRDPWGTVRSQSIRHIQSPRRFRTGNPSWHCTPSCRRRADRSRRNRRRSRLVPWRRRCNWETSCCLQRQSCHPLRRFRRWEPRREALPSSHRKR